MMRKTVIWFDADGVLLDFYTPFKEFCGVNPDFAGKYYDMRDVAEVPGGTLDIAFCIDEFIDTEKYSNLAALTGALNLHMLQNMGFELRVLTQCPVHARQSRIRNLTQKFGDSFAGIHFTDRGECKLQALARLTQDMLDKHHILVEDNPDTLMKAFEYTEGNIYETFKYKLTPVCIKHSYNVHELEDAGYNEHDIIMCDSVKDFTEVLIRGITCRQQ